MKRLAIAAVRDPGSRATLVTAVLTGIQLVYWVSRPRTRVVWRARIDPGDHLEIRGFSRR